MESVGGYEHRLLRLGTSAWSNPTWVGVFYPPGTKPANYLSAYAKKYDCVEVDSTFYRIPTQSMVAKWYADTPAGFIFAAKVPQAITHEKALLDCQEDLSVFLHVMDSLKEKLGPLLIQLPYFNKEAFKTSHEFYARLKSFLLTLPKNYRWALEIRNKGWIKTELLELLKQHNVAFVMIDQSWIPPIDHLLREYDLDTADFAYLRWLGDRKGIEQITKSWDRVVVNREADLTRWVMPVRTLLSRGRQIYGFFNNHYAGHAPASLAMFLELLNSDRQFEITF